MITPLVRPVGTNPLVALGSAGFVKLTVLPTLRVMAPRASFTVAEPAWVMVSPLAPGLRVVLATVWLLVAPLTLPATDNVPPPKVRLVVLGRSLFVVPAGVSARTPPLMVVEPPYVFTPERV